MEQKQTELTRAHDLRECMLLACKMLDKLSEPALVVQARLNDNFKWLYSKTRYIVAILFSDVISGVFGLFALSQTDDMLYKAALFGGFLALALGLQWASQTSPSAISSASPSAISSRSERPRQLAAYLSQMFLSSVLGSLTSLAYAVGTHEYLYLTIGLLGGILALGALLAVAYLHVGEAEIARVEAHHQGQHLVYKHPAIIRQQIRANRPI